MKNLKIGRKLFLGFGIVVLLTLVLGVASVVILRSISDKYSATYEQEVVPLPYIINLVDEIQNSRIYVRSMLLEDNDSDDFKKVQQQYESNKNDILNNIDNYGKTIGTDDSDEKALLDEIIRIYNEQVAPEYDKIADLALEGKNAEAIVSLHATAEVVEEFKQKVTACLDYKIQSGAKDSANNLQVSQTMSVILIVISVVAVAVAVLMGIVLTRGISKPLAAMVDAAEKISLGDVNAEVDYDSKDEIGQLVTAFGQMISGIRGQSDVIQKLAEGNFDVDIDPRSDKDVMNAGLKTLINSNNDVFSEIRRASESVMSGSKQVSDASQNLAIGSTEQASAVAQVKEAISDVSDQTSQNAKKAGQASELGLQIQNLAECGNGQMNEMIEAVNEINQSSDEISKVIKVIDDIAFQTNILALNAAVEAARAGQHGKGFAVVAEEVRTLASKSAEAARNTGEMIESSRSRAQRGVSIAKETAESLGKIVENINTNTALVNEIAQLSSSQAEKINHVNASISQVADVVQSNSATSEETAAASQELASQSEVLGNLIERFRLKDENERPVISQRDQVHLIEDDYFGKY